jgi:hypothetical protein
VILYRRLSFLALLVCLGFNARPVQAQSAASATNPVIKLRAGETVPGGSWHFIFRPPRPLTQIMPQNLRARVADAARQNAALKLITVPYFGYSSALGPVQPFVMVGGNPVAGGTRVVRAQLVALAFTFEGTTDPSTHGPITLGLDVPTLQLILASPNFSKASYGTGLTQYADAIQRAEFAWLERTNWHTMLSVPPLIKVLNIDVPAEIAGVSPYQMYQTSSGTYFATLDYNFFLSQLETVLQYQPSNPHALLMFLTKNLGLLDYTSGELVGGFHDAYIKSQTSNSLTVQTFAYAAWIDPDVSAAIGMPQFVDVTPMSHEISEWMNDPFGINLVNPAWQFPTVNICQGNLEVGDPIEFLPPNLVNYPVNIGGYTYHPQNMALLQWFAQTVPSNAIDGAYSYPNESSLTGPSQSCP